MELSRRQTKLFLDNLGLVASIAGAFKKRYPHLEYEDLYQDGAIGLLQAVRRFKPELGTRIDAFARARIHGEIMDALRRRSLAWRVSRWAGVREARERGEQLQLPVEVAFNDDIRARLRIEPEFADLYLSGRLAEEIRTLPERERFILREYYYMGRTFRAIGKDLHISVPRVSQLHRKILDELRQALTRERLGRFRQARSTPSRS